MNFPGRFALMLVLGVASCADSGANRGASQRVASKNHSIRLALALECSASTRTDARRIVKSVDPSNTRGLAEMCLDTQRLYALSPSIVRIKPRRLEEIYIEIPCLEPRTFYADVKDFPEEGGLVLVSNDQAVAAYLYLHRDVLSRRCGIFLERSLEEAVDLCAHVREAGGQDGEACLSACDERAPASMQDVCVVENATFDWETDSDWAKKRLHRMEEPGHPVERRRD